MKNTRVVICALMSAATLATAGCVRRRIFITSDPPGALVHMNDVEIGLTPAEADFTYSGVYEVRLHKLGYKPVVEGKRLKPNLHDQPLLDLAAEALPVALRTEAHWHFELEPVDSSTDALIERGAAFRARALPEDAPAGDDDQGR